MPLRHLSEADCACIVTFLEENTQRYVANRFRISQSVVSRIYSRFRETSSYHRQPGQSRPHETSNCDDRAIVLQAVQNHSVSARIIAGHINDRRRPTSTSTIRNRLRETGLHARQPIQVPYLTRRHHRLRLNYACSLINWRQRQWNSVLFTDESRFLAMTDESEFGDVKANVIQKIAIDRLCFSWWFCNGMSKNILFFTNTFNSHPSTGINFQTICSYCNRMFYQLKIESVDGFAYCMITHDRTLLVTLSSS